MSGISFDEERPLAPGPQAHTQQTVLVQLVIRWGFAKDEKSALTVLVGVVVVSVVLAIAVPFFLNQKGEPLPAPVVPLPFAASKPQ